jgi:tRNA(Ile)-lysidine synthase
MIAETLRQSLRRLVTDEGPLLVAVSGGIDSTVLLHAVAALVPSLGITCVAAHVNHGLRGEESEQDEACVRSLAERLGLVYRVARIDPSAAREGHASRTRPTLQEAARRLRYEALRKLANDVGADRIATAHHLDDQAETVLMRLLRGCGPDGLAGIPERSSDGVVIRPMLGVTRAEIVAYAQQHQLAWREDASNEDPKYTRNRLRMEWLPALSEAFNPQLVSRIGDLAEAQRRDREWLDVLVDEAARERLNPLPNDGCMELVKTGWNDLPEALARRLVVRALREMGVGRDLTRVHLERALEFLRAPANARSGAYIELPGGLRLLRERRRHLLTRDATVG